MQSHSPDDETASPGCLSSDLITQQGQYQTQGAGDLTNHPQAHGNFGLWPADGLEMMMQRCREKNLLFADLFRENLDGTGAALGHKDERDYRQDKDGVGEYGHHSKGRAKGKGATIPHEES